MRCTSPRTVGFLADGKTLCWSPKNYSKEYAPFQIPCGKCIACRLETARQTAVRCVHEASLYEKNSFITLTYSDENLKSNKLVYKDFQNFVKKLRSHIWDEKLKELFPNANTREYRRQLFKESTKQFQNDIKEKIRISIFATGEYGDKNKRPHWHAIIFNWRPSDEKRKYTNSRGDNVYSSDILDQIWSHGFTEIGAVSLHSAGYCARYAAKKLVHGKDGTHDFNPINRRSCKNAIGKGFIEKYWQDIFRHGNLLINTDKGKKQCGIPRYYEKWLKKNHPEHWQRYVTQVKQKIINDAVEKESKISAKEKLAQFKHDAVNSLKNRQKLFTLNDQKKLNLEDKFKQLTKRHKL